MSDWWYFPKSGPPRKARDGIKARSQRGDIGETWWSRRFVEVLEGFTDGGRLSRGRSYARKGQVMKLRVEAGVVTARVQGSRPKPYDVRIAVAPLRDAEWARVEQAMADRAVFLAALLAGEMPRTIEEAFSSGRVSLFPREPGEVTTFCSCPDLANPCKHVAATYYILAEAFDADPFLIFAWRGRTREELTERLRRLRGAGQAAEEPEPAESEHEPGEPLDTLLDRFWTAPGGAPSLRLDPRATASPDAVLRELGRAPVETGSGPLVDRLAPWFVAMTRAAERRAFGAEGERPADPGGGSAGG